MGSRIFPWQGGALLTSKRAPNHAPELPREHCAPWPCLMRQQHCQRGLVVAIYGKGQRRHVDVVARARRSTSAQQRRQNVPVRFLQLPARVVQSRHVCGVFMQRRARAHCLRLGNSRLHTRTLTGISHLCRRPCQSRYWVCKDGGWTMRYPTRYWSPPGALRSVIKSDTVRSSLILVSTLPGHMTAYECRTITSAPRHL